jgi:hypothetical protein
MSVRYPFCPSYEWQRDYKNKEERKNSTALRPTRCVKIRIIRTAGEMSLKGNKKHKNTFGGGSSVVGKGSDRGSELGDG